MEWYNCWYELQPGDIWVALPRPRFLEIGKQKSNDHGYVAIEQACAVLTRWMRNNCKTVAQPANVRGQIGWVFRDTNDALIFKLTWAG